MSELPPPHYDDIEVPENTIGGICSNPIRYTQNLPQYSDVCNTQPPTYNDVIYIQQPIHLQLQPHTQPQPPTQTQHGSKCCEKCCEKCWLCIYNPLEPSCCHCYCLFGFCQCFFSNYNKTTNCPSDPCIWYDQEVCYPVSTQQQFCSDVCCPLRCLICLPCLGATFVKCQWNIVGDLIHCTKGIDYCCY